MGLKNFILTEVIPLPTPEQNLNPDAEFNRYKDAIDTIRQTAASAEDPKLLDLSLKLFDNDASRRTSIDSRVASMMSAITLAATLVTGVGFTTLKDTSGLAKPVFWAMFVTFVLALLYLTSTIVLLFKIQGPVVRSTPDPADLPKSQSADPSTYYRDVAVRMLRYTVVNYKVNNRVANRLTMAQNCLRNGIVALVVGGVATVLLILATPAPPSGIRLAQALAIGAGCSDLPNLTVDPKGRWAGKCVRSGRPASVVVDSDGRTEFLP